MRKTEKIAILKKITECENTMKIFCPRADYLFLGDIQKELLAMGFENDDKFNSMLCLMINYKEFHSAVTLKYELEKLLR